jgi:hypothetical protein
MNRRTSFVVIALAALVAGAGVLVYARQDEPTVPQPAPIGGETLVAAGQPPIAESGAAKQPTPSTEPPSAGPEISYNLDALPEPVKRMLQEIIDAAQSGDIEKMRPVLESNELKPMVSTSAVDDPIAYWKKASADGMGRDVLAAMLNVLASGYVRVGKGQDEMYVWPYFAETNLALLTPPQEVELYRIMSPSIAVSMKQAGKYSYYRLGISPSGVWHYFLQ